MADTAPQTGKASSVPAIITFWILGLWSAVVIAKFAMVGFGLTIDATSQGFLSNAESTTQNLLLMAVSFWVGSSVGAKATGDALAERGKTDSATLAQLAGAGPPPPAPPLGEAPEPTPDAPRPDFMHEPIK